MKDLGIILLILLLAVAGVYITQQNNILALNRKEKAVLQKQNSEIKEQLEKTGISHARTVKQAQDTIDRTAKERDALNRLLAMEKLRSESLRTTVKTLSETLKEQLQKDAEEDGTDEPGRRISTGF